MIFVFSKSRFDFSNDFFNVACSFQVCHVDILVAVVSLHNAMQNTIVTCKTLTASAEVLFYYQAVTMIVAQWFKQLKTSRPFRIEKAERADIAHYTLFMLEGYVEFPKLVAEYLMSPILIVLLNTNCKLRYSVTNTNVNPTLFLMPCKLLWGITNLQCCNSCHLPSDFHPNFNHA